MHLYVYDHCPFCAKVRMIVGFNHIDCPVSFVLNDDEQTPIKMIGQKMLPILAKDDGTFMGESEEIITYFYETQPNLPALLASQNKALIHWVKTNHLLMARLVWPRNAKVPLAELATPSARAFYEQSRSAVIGDFAENLANSPELISQAETALQELDSLLSDLPANPEHLTRDDLVLFPTLRSFSIVKNLLMPPKVVQYANQLAQRCQLPLFTNVAL